jgi:RNA polymerase sigma-70 factor (ECF subfamily)
VSADERELIARCQQGDLDAFEPLVAKYRERVWRLAYQVLRDREEAWDVAQEAFVRAYQSIREFRGQSAFYTWLFRIVVNLATDRLRQQSARARAFGGEAVTQEEWERTAADSGSPPDQQASRAEERERIGQALDALPPHHRAIIILSDIEGLSYREIAQVLGCPMGTVMSRLHNARKRLRALLGPLLGLLVAVWLAGSPVPAFAQAQSVLVIVRILSTASSPPGGAALVPGARPPDEEFRPHLNRLRQMFPHQSPEQLDTIRVQIPLGLAQRFGLPGGRELEMRPLAVQGPAVQMDVKILKGGVPEIRVIPTLWPNRPTMVGGPPYSDGVLIIAITARPQ